MDNPAEHTIHDDAQDDPPRRDETAIRAMLEQSLRDIEAGRIVPMEPVLERMRAVAERIRRGQDSDATTPSTSA